MKYAVVCSREQFLEWLGLLESTPPSKRIGAISVVPHALRLDEVLLLWNQRPTNPGSDSLPVIVVPSPRAMEFFAFVNTYVSTYVPLTAFFRVLIIDPDRNLQRQLQRFENREVSRRLVHESIVGLAIAEAAAQIGSNAESVSAISIRACLGTMSSSVISAIWHGYNSHQLLEVAGSWTRAREALGSDKLTLSAYAISRFWEVVGPALAEVGGGEAKSYAGPNPEITEVVRRFAIDGYLDSAAWLEAVRYLPELKEAPEKLAGTREDRVRAFDSYLRVTSSSRHVDDISREFAVGTLLAQLADGSFEYLPLALSLSESFPTASLWFALFTSLRKGNDALVVGNCLGRRVARQVCKATSLFDAPTDDISIGELVVLGSERKGERIFRTENQSTIAVELYPGISGRFRHASGVMRDADLLKKPISPESIREMRYLIHRMSTLVDDFDVPAQPDLFPIRKSRSKTSSRISKS